MKKNNFDLIRLFAAAQVAIEHGAYHLNIKSWILHVLGYLPGVPIFFFISGYLIYKSYSNINECRLKIFFVNRFLRLYPALIFCYMCTVASIYYTGYFEKVVFTIWEYVTWVITSLTIFQFYNPEFLRGYGVGSTNGSLWTIAVELQFYILTPIIYFAIKNKKREAIPVVIMFLLANVANSAFNDKTNVLLKLFAVSFIPWIYMFIVGALVSANETIIKKILSYNIAYYIAAYIASCAIADYLSIGSGNEINPISYLILAALVLKFAYTRPNLSNRILHGNDISYGVYIYHMPVLNFLIYTHSRENQNLFAAYIVITAMFATFSWFAIERNCLGLKTSTIRNFYASRSSAKEIKNPPEHLLRKKL